ncbi:MAG: beta-propeller fold lactonase family protein [Vicinamibacterales bacterium]
MVRPRMGVIGVTVAVMTTLLRAQGPQVQAPTFQVDPFWPRPLPNHWLLGSITGVAVDAQNHVWVIHRGGVSLHARTEMGAASNPPTAQECCVPAPQVLRFDPAGRVAAQWGGPGEGYDWPQSPGAIAVDAKGSVWIAASGPGEPQLGGRGRGANPSAPAPALPPSDGHVLKFSSEGRFLLQIGKPGRPADSNSTAALRRPTAIAVDAVAGEVYVADGLDSRRIIVFDSETGDYKRHWGAYGAKPEDAEIGSHDPAAAPARQFRAPSCVNLSKDGFVYVCDRRNNRIQVFRKDGTFVREAVVAKSTLGEGSTWSIAFSHDPQERFLYVADGSNQKVWVLERGSLNVVSTIGSGGRLAGQFYGVGSVAVDSSGNVYTGETYEGKRVQKFVFKGLGRATAKEDR